MSLQDRIKEIRNNCKHPSLQIRLDTGLGQCTNCGEKLMEVELVKPGIQSGIIENVSCIKVCQGKRNRVYVQSHK
jgi:hypothetical protein